MQQEQGGVTVLLRCCGGGSGWCFGYHGCCCCCLTFTQRARILGEIGEPAGEISDGWERLNLEAGKILETGDHLYPKVTILDTGRVIKVIGRE
jgi:hypothetical protein